MTPFEKIYNAAKNKNFSLIRTILEEDGVSLGVQNHLSLTPVGMLVSEGEFEIVETLSAKFQIYIDWKAYGAAHGGHIQFALDLLNNHGANVNIIACGAALGGYIQFALDLLNNYSANVNTIARGAARGGYIQFALDLLNNHGANVNDIARGAALGGHIQFALDLLNNHGANPNSVARGAARAGYIQFARDLLNNHGANVNVIACGAALGGYIQFALDLLNNHGANPNSVARDAAQGGHIQFALDLLNNHGANVNIIARGAARGGYIQFALDLLNNHGANVNIIARDAALGGHIQFALDLLNNHGANVNDIAEGATLGGNIKFALELLNNHGANVNHIARFAVLNTNIKFVLKLLNNHGAEVNNIAYYAGEAGNIELVRKLLNYYGANVNNIALGAVIGRHTELALELHNNHGADINHIADVIGRKRYVSNPQRAYQFFLNIKNSKNRKVLIQTLKNSSHVKALVKDKLLEIDTRIENIYKFKNTYDIGIQQALFLHASPEIRIFMMQCYGPLIRGDFKVKNENDELVKSPSYISPDIIWHICLFLAPAFMSYQTVENLSFKLQQKALVRVLDAYTNKPKGLVNGWFTKKPPHLNRAISFKNAVSSTNSLNSMKALVNQQVGLFANINKYNAQGKTPLIIAIESGDLEKTISLLKQGANPSIPQQSNKQTPLALAILAGHTDIIDVLLEYHAQPGLADKNGVTPYQLALQLDLDKEILDKLASVPSTINPPLLEEPLCENEHKQDGYYLALKQSQARIT